MKKKSNLLFSTLMLFSILNAENKIQVFQPPTSSCPKSWFTDMESISNEIEVVTVMDVKSLKRDIGIPKEIQSCNTTLMDDYVFEGNVPSKAIKDFLKDRPINAIGLSLPAYENDKNPKTVFVIFEDKTYREFGKY